VLVNAVTALEIYLDERVDSLNLKFKRSGFDLRLMSSLSDVSGVTTEGKKLIIVAAVEDVLHFRILGGDGKVVVDTDEKRLTEQAVQINALREQLKRLWPPHELTRSDKDRVITAVTSIVGHTQQSPKDESWGWYVRSLSHERLCSPSHTKYPVRLETLARADVFRTIRNQFVHGLKLAPSSTSDSRVGSLTNNLTTAIKECWPSAAAATIAEDAREHTLGRAITKSDRSRRLKNAPPVEYFVTLFAFTSFDNLAFEIEEALIPPGSMPAGRVRRKGSAIRRPELRVYN
jgi:hypothetical protein